MKRYDIGMATSFGVATRKMREYDTGDYVKYEDARLLMIDMLSEWIGPYKEREEIVDAHLEML